MTFQGNSGSTSSNITTVVSNPNPPAPASSCGDPASQLVWVAQPGNGKAGTALFPAPTLVLEDAAGCVEQNDASQVSLAVSSGPGALRTASRTWFGRDDVPELHAQRARDVHADCHRHHRSHHVFAQQLLYDRPGFAGQARLGTNPGNGTGGLALNPQPVVFIEDSSGNIVSGDSSTVTLAIGTNPGGGTLSGCTDSTVNGVASFSGCAIDKIGTGYTLTATDAADNLTTPSAPSAPFNVTAGPAAQLAFTTSPTTTVAGDPLAPQPAVTVEDAGGNPTTTNMGTVSLTIGTNSGGGALSGCTSSTSGATVTFSGCAINNAGTGYTLVAKDGSLTPATSAAFNVVTPALTSFKVVAQNSTPTAGAPFNVTITALDQSGFTFPGETGPQAIGFSGPSNSPSGKPPAYPTTVPFSGGTGTASVTLYDAQTTTLTRAQGSATGTSGNITVSALGTTTGFSLSNPSPVSAGTSFNETVSAVDQYGNVTTGYRGTVHFTSTDGRAVLPANYTFRGSDAGVRYLYGDPQDRGHSVDHGHRHGDRLDHRHPGRDHGQRRADVPVRGHGLPEPDDGRNGRHPDGDGGGRSTATSTTGYTGTVHFTSTDGQAVLPANYTFTGRRRRRAHLHAARSRRRAPRRSRPPTR